MTALDRPLDRTEAFFWLLDRCSSMNFTVVLEGHGPLDPARLAQALAEAGRRHPALACAVEAPQGRLAFVPREGARIDLAVEAVGEDWLAATAARLAEPFPLGAAPLARARLATRAGGGWVFELQFHHAIADGRSGIALAREVLEQARGGPVPAAVDGARRSFFDLFPAGLAGESGLAKAGEWRAQLKREATGRPEAIPAFAREARPIRPGIVQLRLGESEVAALAARARAEGASVHGALGAAQLAAVAGQFEPGHVPTLTLTSPVDLRAHLAEPVDAATPGFYVSLLSSTHAVDGRAELWPLARFLTEDLRRQVAAGGGHLFYHLVPPAETVPPVPEAIDQFRAYMQRMHPACALSNVGRLAPMGEANGIAVDDVSFALCPMAHQPLFAAATTFGGRLTLNLVHDANRLAPAVAQAIAASMRERLSAALA